MIPSAALLAETQQPAAGGTAWFLPVMLVIMALMLWFSVRRQKKARDQVKEKQATMGPGTQVMTSFGLFGTLVSIDRDQNKAVLEVSPGNRVTVHSQTVTTVVEETSTDSSAHTANGAVSESHTAGPTAAHGTINDTTNGGAVADGSSAVGRETDQDSDVAPGTLDNARHEDNRPESTN